MAHKKKGDLLLGYIRNERGALFAAAIVLLFFISLFLFSIVSWHDSIYRSFNSFETYYENETMKIMIRDK